MGKTENEEYVMKKCTLSKDINNCPFYNKEKMECHKEDTKCAFQIKDEPKTYVKKEEKWYEKYYKDSRPKRS